jgi:hypothetical protein
MTDELKDKFQQLVADPPPSNGVPSDAVFTRIRTIRRRRTAGVALLAAAATVAVVAVAAFGVTGLNSAPPPVVGTTSAPTSIATGPPTTSTPLSPRTSEPPATKPTNTATSTTSNTSPNPPTNTNKPVPPPSNKNTSPPIIKPTKLTFTLHPTIKGMTVTMRFTTSGSILIPVIERTGKSLPSDMAFQDLSYMTGYTWGDGSPGAGANAALLTCKGANKRVTGQGTDEARDPHTYAKAGNYTFTYTVWYCGTSGIEKVTKTMELTVG